MLFNLFVPFSEKPKVPYRSTVPGKNAERRSMLHQGGIHIVQEE